jgi:predicted acetyltransferase
MELRWPSEVELPGYVEALERGWSPNTLDEQAGWAELDRIRRDPHAFLASLVDRDAAGPAISLPDGSTAERIPGFRKWMWDGAFCGTIGLRWRPGTEELPPHVLGHVGYSVVPWKRRRGYATAAVLAIRRDAAAEGLRWVDITTDTDNIASQRVIEGAGGTLLGRFTYPPEFGDGDGLRYRLDVTSGADIEGSCRV